MSNRTYDLVVLLDADAPSDTRAKIVNDAQTLINQHGDVKATKDWGTRQLPYLIDHHEQAAYHVFQFESRPDVIAQLDRGLKLTEGVLRFRIFETDPGGTIPDSPPLFKREERGYERPPREADATAAIEETPAAEAPAAAAPATDADGAPAGEAAAPTEAPAESPAEASAAPAEAPAEIPAANPAEAPTADAGEPPAEAPATEPAAEPAAE